MTKKAYQDIRIAMDLKKKSAPLIVYIMVELAIISFGIFLTKTQLYFLNIPILAIVMFRNFSLMHDAVHGSISNWKWFNNLIGYWSGCISLLPFRSWKEIHLKHHFWSGNIKKDPVMGLRVSLPKTSAFTQFSLTLTWRKWIPALALLQYVLFWKYAIHFTVKSRSPWCYFGFISPFVWWGLFFILMPKGFIANIFIPSLFLYMLAIEIVNFPHHLDLPMLDGDSKAPVWEQYKTARTCIYPRWFARHVVLNFNFHSEHHMFPDAPWYTLETIHQNIKVVLGEKENVDFLFAWTRKNRSRSLIEVICAPIDENKMAS